MARSAAEVSEVLRLHARGASALGIAKATGVPRSTVRDWIAGRGLRTDRSPHEEGACRAQFRLSADYAFVLGLYLGDGCLSQQSNGVWKLRLVCDARYPDLVDEWALAVASVVPRVVGRVAREGCIEIYSHSRHWLCLLPQHGPGRKHERSIILETWQVALIRQHPAPFVRGLLFSDGCRVVNRVKHYQYGRYFFTNESADILAIADDALQSLGVTVRHPSTRNLSVARADDVQLLDRYVGWKH